MSDVTLAGVRKSFGATEVLHGIDLEVKDGEFVVFVGPSGCGKSTLLRMIAGLEKVTQGEISIDGRRGQRRAAGRARHRHGLPVLRALSAHERLPRTWRSA